MDLDRPRTELELHGDLLARLPGHHPQENFALSLAQPREAALDLGARRLEALLFFVECDRPCDHVEQVLVAEWLLDEIEGTCLERTNDDGDVGKPGDQDHGEIYPARMKL